MVVYLLRNSRAPNKVVPITVAINREVLVSSNTAVRPDQNPVATGTEFPNYQDPEGEDVWVITLSTTERDADGDLVTPEIINLVSKATAHLELSAALGRLGKRIDWGPLSVDDYAPQVIDLFPPLDMTEGVPISSNLIIRLEDPLPAAGIDLSTLHMHINGLPVITSGTALPGMNVEFRGNVFDMSIIHRPRRVM